MTIFPPFEFRKCCTLANNLLDLINIVKGSCAVTFNVNNYSQPKPVQKVANVDCQHGLGCRDCNTAHTGERPVSRDLKGGVRLGIAFS